MSEPTIDIERVVREVLAELGVAPEWLSATVVPPSPNRQSIAADSPRLVVASRVVTMAEIAGRLDSVRRLVVSREAVVTPAVRDELLRRGSLWHTPIRRTAIRRRLFGWR